MSNESKETAAMALVPWEPTREMRIQGNSALDECKGSAVRDQVYYVYRAMLAAAPAPAQAEAAPAQTAADYLEEISIEHHTAPAQAEPVAWACAECGSMGEFKTVHYEAGDCDVQCVECGSVNTGEAANIVLELALKVDELKAAAPVDSKGTAAPVEVEAIEMLGEVREFLADNLHTQWAYVENGQQAADIGEWVGRLDKFLDALDMKGGEQK